MIDSFEFEAAGKFCEKAVQQEPDNVRCIETMALMLMECAQLDQAKIVNIRSLRLLILVFKIVNICSLRLLIFIV